MLFASNPLHCGHRAEAVSVGMLIRHWMRVVILHQRFWCAADFARKCMYWRRQYTLSQHFCEILWVATSAQDVSIHWSPLLLDWQHQLRQDATVAPPARVVSIQQQAPPPHEEQSLSRNPSCPCNARVPTPVRVIRYTRSDISGCTFVMPFMGVVLRFSLASICFIGGCPERSWAHRSH